ncbi:MAG: hypothetical protein ACOZD0_01245 [Pseudomonadota bacterium]|jgi:hypothetical protein
MQAHAVHGVLKIVSALILLLMLVAVVYAGGIALTYWSGIGV